MSTINNPFQPSLHTLERPAECRYCKKNLLVGGTVRVYDGNFYCYEHSQNCYSSGNEAPSTYGNFFLQFDNHGFEISFYPQVVLQQQTTVSVISRTPIIMLSNERVFQMEVFHVQDQTNVGKQQEQFFQIEEQPDMIHIKVKGFEQPESNPKLENDEIQQLQQNGQQFEYQQMPNIAGLSQMEINPRYKIYKATDQRYGFRYKYLQINLVLSYPPPNCRQLYYQYNVHYVLRADIAKQFLLNQYPKNEYITQEFAYLMFKPTQQQCTRIIEFDNKGCPVFNKVSEAYQAEYAQFEKTTIQKKKAILDQYIMEQEKIVETLKEKWSNQDQPLTLSDLENLVKMTHDTASSKMNVLYKYLLSNIQNSQDHREIIEDKGDYTSQLDQTGLKSPSLDQFLDEGGTKHETTHQDIHQQSEPLPTEDAPPQTDAAEQDILQSSISEGSTSPIQTAAISNIDGKKKQQLSKFLQGVAQIPCPTDDFSQPKEENHFSIYLNDSLIIQNRAFNPSQMLVYSYTPVEPEKISTTKRDERSTASFMRNYLVMNDFMHRFVNYQIYLQTVAQTAANTLPLIIPESPVLCKLTIELYSKFQQIRSGTPRLDWSYYQNFLNFYCVLFDTNGDIINDCLEDLHRLNSSYRIRPKRVNKNNYQQPAALVTLGLLNMNYYYQLIQKQITSEKVRDDDTKLFGTDKIFMEPFYLNTFLSARLSFPYFKFSISNCYQLYISESNDSGFEKGSLGRGSVSGAQSTNGIQDRGESYVLSNIQGDIYVYRELDQLQAAMSDPEQLIDVKQFNDLEQLCQNYSIEEMNYIQQMIEQFSTMKQTNNYYNFNNYTEQSNTQSIQYLGGEIDDLMPDMVSIQACIDKSKVINIDDVVNIVKNNISLFCQQNLLRKAEEDAQKVPETTQPKKQQSKQEPTQVISKHVESVPVQQQKPLQIKQTAAVQKPKQNKKIQQIEVTSSGDKSTEYSSSYDNANDDSDYTDD